MSEVRRREFITLLGGASVWPLAARAQLADRVWRIGVLMPFVESDPEGQRRVNAFLQGLKELGWIRGRNVQIDYRWVAADDADRIRVYTAELVGLKPDVIVCQSTHAVVALKKQTRTIPVVFAQVTDPVGNGIVEGLARPGGNITGFTNFEFSMGGKWIEVLKEIDPRVAHVAVIFNPDTAPQAGFILRSIEVAAPSFAAEPIAAPLHDAAGIESTLAALGQRAGGGVIVMPDAFTTTHRDLIVALAARHHVPAIYPFRYMIAAGGLISYGNDALHATQQVALYVDRILRGIKPGDLPVQQPTKFELAINLKTAKALGLEVPPTLLARADEVIE